MKTLEVVLMPAFQQLLDVLNDDVARLPGLRIQRSTLDKLVACIVLDVVVCLLLAETGARGTRNEHIDVGSREPEMARYVFWWSVREVS